MKRTLAFFARKKNLISLITMSVSAASLMGLSTPSYASLMTWYQQSGAKPVFSFGAGTASTSDAGTSSQYIQGSDILETYHYSGHQPTQTSGIGEAMLGAEMGLNDMWRMQLGLDYTQASAYTANGSFTQGFDATSTSNYGYHYRISTKQLLVLGKFLYTYKTIFHPYALVGVGAGFNDAYNYNTSASPFMTFTRQYSNNNTTSFSYALGVGVDVDVNEQLRAGIGYRLVDAGSVDLGNSYVQDPINVPGHLSQNSLYTNEVLAQLTFLF